MKITLLTAVLAMFFTLPAFSFSLGDLLNSTGKTEEPRQTTGPDSATTSAGSGAAVSESPDIGQQGLADVDTFLNIWSNPDQPRRVRGQKPRLPL